MQELNKNNHNEIHLKIAGMTCQACASRIEKVLNKKSAIYQADVNFANETARVIFDNQQITQQQILEWVEKAGFSASIQQQEDLFQTNIDEENHKIPYQLVLTWICLLPFLLGMVGMLFGSHRLMPPVWLQFLLATVVQFILATSFYKSAWASIRGGLANMDVLVVLGTLTIWIYSTYIWFSGGDTAHQAVYFEAGVMVIAFIRLGKYLEERTKKHSLNSINLLLALTPQQVTIKDRTGNWQSVALSQVKVGQTLLAKQGSRIACDGVVSLGDGWCDESHLTGESIPQQKQVGSLVLAGAMVENGGFEYQATALGSQTQLGDMIQALNEAQGTKADIARLADKVAGVFVPVVVVMAIITFVGNYWLFTEFNEALMRAVSVLVIACPCALGLATPAGIMAGMGVSARHGVWFKDAQALETSGTIDTIVLDKTGTLTEGKPKLVDYYLANNSLKIDEVLALVASVENHANHPLATALVNQAKQRQLQLLPVYDVQTVIGQGIQANIDNLGLVKVGSLTFANTAIPEQLLSEKLWQVASVVAVSVDNIPLAIFAFADALKSDSSQVIEKLQQDGLDVIIMSGDKQSVVDYIAQQVHIKQAFGQLSPREKANKIQQLQQQGKKVAMVGDGVNDAPAMAMAHASFAVYQGTDIAQHSASARLMGDSLVHVDYAQKISKATLKNIKQNLFFAFIYNCLGIPLASLGLLNPMIAAAAMALSSISVLFNAIRLKSFTAKES